MPKRTTLPIAAVCALALAAPVTALAATPTPIPGQYIVVLKGGNNGHAVAKEHARSAGARVLHTYDAALHGYAARLSDSGLARVKQDPRVRSVTQDLEGKPLFGQMLPTEVNRTDADVSPTAQMSGDGSGTVNGDVAVYDSGIQVNHPDLNVAGGVDCLGSDPYQDNTYGDQYGHGTHVAGIIGAKDDGIGVTGEAPGVRLWSVRVVNSQGGSSSSAMLCGINWLTANAPSLGIKVVNASMGLFGKPEDNNCGWTAGDVLHQALCSSVTTAGITWVFAAGNSSTAVTNLAGGGWREVLNVTASGDSNGLPNVGSTASSSCGSAIGGSKTKTTYTDDKVASFSDYAATAAQQAHTVAAPGVCIYSTFTGSSYGYLSGTSMSSPAAAGIVELCIVGGQCPSTPPNTIQKIVADAAAYNQGTPSYGYTNDPLHSPLAGKYYGYQLRAGIY